jgi:hypothetical protein
MILRWGLIIITLLYLPSIRSQENGSAASTKTPSCDPGLFACVGDGSCIPEEWLNDNEIDCADGSDEQGTNTGNSPSLQLSTKSSKIKQKVREI